MGVVDSFEAYEPDQRVLTEEFGYESLGEYGVAGRDFLFRYGDDNFHVSVFQAGDENIRNNLRLRDELASDDSLRAQYVQLKRLAAAAHPDDYSAYNDTKASLIAEILRRQW
jgi:GrpB-like predicted nucleotidyltransferase (UPF0157 family)